MNKKLLLYILAPIVLFIFSCEKGEYIDIKKEFSIIDFQQINGPQLAELSFNGNLINRSGQGYLLPIDKSKDSVEIKLKFKGIDNTLTKKFKLESGKTTFFIYEKSPIDSSLIFSKNHPLDGQVVPDGYFQLKMFNTNKFLSPDGSPIHLAIYGIVGELDPFNPVYTENPVDTIFNITPDYPEQFSLIKRQNYSTPDGGQTALWKIKILKADKTPLTTIDGKNIYTYIAFPNTIKTYIMYTLNYDNPLLDPWDQNSYMELPDGGVSSTFFNVYLSK